MAKIKAEYGAMISAADRLRNSAKNVSSMYDEVTRILKNMPLSTNYYRGVQGKMLLQSESIQQTGKKLETAAGAVEQIVSMYKAADLAAANGTAVAYAKANANILGGMAGLFDDKSWLEKVAGIVNGKMTISKMNGMAILGGMALASPALTLMGLYGLVDDNKRYVNSEGKIKLPNGDFDGIFEKFNDKIKDKLTKDGKFKEKSSDMLSKDFEILSVGGEKSVSLLHFEGSHEGERFSAKGSADVLTAGYTLSAGLGKFSYKDKDGKDVNAYGVFGEASVNAAAAKAEGEVRYGTDAFGVYAKGDVKVLSAAANAECAVGWSSKGLQAKVGVGAEANLAEVSASTGIRVAGTDVGVKASAKVGVGAKADVGFKDGKFTFDVGASLGVGFELGFDVDVSDTIDFISEKSKTFESWANEANKAVDDAWNATTTTISNIADDAGKAIDKGFKEAGKTLDKIGDKFSKLFGG